MPKLPKYLARLQKRARDKESRLRVKGASESAISMVSPRLDAATVANMTSREQRNYAARLRNFNKRENRILVLESGETVKYKEYQRLVSKAREYNRMIQRQARGIERAAQTISPSRSDYLEKVEELRLLAGRPAGMSADEYARRLKDVRVMGRIGHFEMTEPPASKRALAARKRMLSEMADPRTTARRRRALRKAIRKMLVETGRKDLWDEVRRMSDTQFDVMVTVTPFMDNLSIDYNASTLLISHGRDRDEVLAEALAGIEESYALLSGIVETIREQVR